MRNLYVRKYSKIRMIFNFLLFTPVFSASAANPSAQVNIPPSIEAGVINQQLSRQPISQLPVANKLVASEQKTLINPAIEKIVFVLKKVNITGSTLFSASQLLGIYSPYLNKTINMAVLQNIADKITAKYREAGYILSKAILPPQTIKNGEVTFQIIEGSIQHVTIAGKPASASALLQAYGRRLENTKPITIEKLERYALLSNSIPGIQTHLILSPASSVIYGNHIGAADLTIESQFAPVQGYLAYDNRGTRYLGPLEYSAGINFNSVFVSGDKTGVQVLNTTKPNELKYVHLNYQTPLTSDGLTLDLAGSYAHTNPGYILAPLNIVGISKIASAYLSYPVWLTQSENLFINGGFDLQNSDNNIDFTSVPLNIYTDRIRSIRVGFSYSGADKWQGINQLSGQYSQGLSIFGASNANALNLSRPQGHSQYEKINLGASHLQNLSHHFSLLGAVQGQYAFNSLLSEEQFYFGGQEYGRAYDSAEIAGDRGIAARTELRYDQNTAITALPHLQYYTFYDIGKVWNVNTFNDTFPNQSASSAGLGVRGDFIHNIFIDLQLAKPLTRIVAAENNKNMRFFFNVMWRF